MVKLSLKKTERWDDKEALAMIVGNAPLSGGYNIHDVRMGVKILDKTEAATDAIELEDAEYSFLRQRLAKQEWKAAIPEVIDFVDRVEAASA